MMRRFLCLLGLVALLAVRCGRSGAGAPADRAETSAVQPVQVKTRKPERRTIARPIEQPGDIHANQLTPLHARISGFVEKVSRDIGDEVKKGDELAVLSVPEMDQELLQKSALITQAKAEVTLAQSLHAAALADTKSARAKVGEAKASTERAAAEHSRARSQLTRLEKSSGVIAQEILEEARLNQEAAKAAVAEVAARIASAEAAVTAAEAREARAKADILVAGAKQTVAETDEARMKALLGYAKLTAPFAGIVTKRHIDPGHFLQPGQGGKSEPAFVVASIDPVRVYVDVPESESVLIRKDLKATVRVAALNREEFEGAVKRTAWALDARVKTLRVEIDLPNKERRLLPGMYVTAIIHAERKALTIPAAAVQTHGEETFCFLLEDGKAIRTPINVGLRDGTEIEVSRRRTAGKDGQWVPFTGEERIITGPLAGLSSGQAVRE